MTRMLRAVCALAVLGISVVGGTAAQAQTGATVAIREVDTTRFPEVRVAVAVNSAASPKPSDFALRENGRIVSDIRVIPLSQTEREVGVVVVVDVSGSMKANDKIGAAKAAAAQFVAQKASNVQIALVPFASEPLVSVNFTPDPAPVVAAIGTLNATGETALHDALRVAAGLLTDRPELQPNIVLLSDGKDSLSSSTLDQAVASVVTAKAAVHAVGLRGGKDFESAPLQRLAAESGGSYVETADPKALGGLYSNIQKTLQNQYDLVYQSPSATPGGELAIGVSVAGQTAKALVTAGGVSSGRSVDPVVIPEPVVPFFLRGLLGRVVIGALVLLAAGAFSFGLLALIVRERPSLDVALAPYSFEGQLLEPQEGVPASRLAETAIVQRAVEAVERVAHERGVIDALSKRLEQADLPLRPGEALFFNAAAFVVLTTGALFLGNPLLVLAVALITGVGPIALLNARASRRLRKFTSLLPDTMQLLSSSLRAGYSVMQGLETVAEEAQEPMAKELRRVVVEIRLGRPVDEALQEAADRMGSKDFDWAVMAIRIQRDVGGNLAELLNTVADTMLARERLRREVSALTAEGRISAILLGVLSPGLCAFIFFVNPGYVRPLFTTGVGQALLGGGIVLAIAGFLWMKKIIEIEI